MSVKIKYFVHGTTEDNEVGLCSGWRDAKLSKKGIERVKNLGELKKNTHFDVIFSSDLSRSVESAKLAFPDILKLTDSRLRECNYGNLEGKGKKLVKYEEHINDAFPEGESLKDVEVRVSEFIDYLKENYDGKIVGIVAHRAPQLAFEVITKNKTWETAIKEDWRNVGNWQPGWDYLV